MLHNTYTTSQTTIFMIHNFFIGKYLSYSESESFTLSIDFFIPAGEVQNPIMIFAN